ncbi:MAG: hypothetical protein AAF658_22565 [Myxococcota bacterium]
MRQTKYELLRCLHRSNQMAHLQRHPPSGETHWYCTPLSEEKRRRYMFTGVGLAILSVAMVFVG